MRRRQSEKREVVLDPIYNDAVVTRLINKIMIGGKKSKAEMTVYKALETLSEKTKQPPMEAFKKAIGNVKPLLEVRPRRVGGATYQIPFEVPERRAVSLAIRWIVSSARSKSGKPLRDKLALELIDAYNGQGNAVKKREDVHKMAEAGKAYAHFRW
ncbi:MAG TPA: 30S ribosomal protein S7 [Mesotoga infera]|jgi:small subunit ribosomal protein S7|uniref:Small ribosomal subunit protein uS7 n=1 Tax=Mesotoga infera TaxID=1236046 RepID=A0A7Z7PMF6_9BACT|nr:30S ribosomal protein S7 [Mesotoga infera]MBP8659521.1 30S ribosomal protein S7 [Mesotoga sp.]NLI05572.1 30S ribosomal protein S7 [Thermotogaceae bacterium]SSC11804.1 30S ribosomal subunit protein S7 [Mesotoga infera]HNR80214.1 30S ribosomal protein S7 [Mesotoga infera]HNS67487.1 30S ribosomal protein S7 [Mesotoga infera]